MAYLRSKSILFKLSLWRNLDRHTVQRLMTDISRRLRRVTHVHFAALKFVGRATDDEGRASRSPSRPERVRAPRRPHSRRVPVAVVNLIASLSPIPSTGRLSFQSQPYFHVISLHRSRGVHRYGTANLLTLGIL